MQFKLAVSSIGGRALSFANCALDRMFSFSLLFRSTAIFFSKLVLSSNAAKTPVRNYKITRFQHPVVSIVMAKYLAEIFGTEKDKVNCSFYFKIGACRHGDKCSRIHNKPTFSQTVLLQNLYHNPKRDVMAPNAALVGSNDAEEQQHFDEFFEEIFTELEDKYGEIEEMNVCDNIGEHMIGNVYVKFKNEEDTEKAVEALNNRWFGGAPVYAEFSPVTDFREACCRQYELGDCAKGGFCNFMHLKPISRELRRRLYGRKRTQSPVGRPGGGRNDRFMERRRSRSRDRSRRGNRF